MTLTPYTTLAVAASILSGCGPSTEGEPCTITGDCADGLVCLHSEDSLEGSCYPPECSENWTGYGCLLDTGTVT